MSMGDAVRPAQWSLSVGLSVRWCDDRTWAERAMWNRTWVQRWQRSGPRRCVSGYSRRVIRGGSSAVPALGNRHPHNKKGAASDEATPRRTQTCLVSGHSVESASRTALALDTKAFLLHAVEMPAIDTAMDGGPVTTSGWSSSSTTRSGT